MEQIINEVFSETKLKSVSLQNSKIVMKLELYTREELLLTFNNVVSFSANNVYMDRIERLISKNLNTASKMKHFKFINRTQDTLIEIYAENLEIRILPAKKRIVVWGPPGSGKSTMVKLALLSGIDAHCLDELGNTRFERKQVLDKLIANEWGDIVLYSPADLKIEDFPTGTKSVLLLPPKEEYISRVEGRNKLRPHKANQDELHWYDEHAKWKHLYDLVITEAISPEETLSKILGV